MTALDALFARPAWQQHAACSGLGPDLFFIGRGEPATDAKAVCAGCPVRAECAEAGLREDWGVWGGMSDRQRRIVRRQRRQARNQERRAS